MISNIRSIHTAPSKGPSTDVFAKVTSGCPFEFAQLDRSEHAHHPSIGVV
jgi:hypothetical protein